MLASPFSTRNHHVLRGLFAHLDAPFSETDPAANARTAMDLWFNEHRQTTAEYTTEQLLGVLPFGTELGLLGENLPAEGTQISRMNNPGGTVRAMIKRFRLYWRLELHGEQLGSFVCWGGQRLRDLKLGESLADLMAFIQANNPALFQNAWIQSELAKDDNHPDRYQRPFATETEILILCAFVIYGNELTLKHTETIVESATIEGVPARTILYYQYSRPDGPDIFVVNSAAVKRSKPNGDELEPRPTVVSTAKDVAAIFGFDGVQGIMVSNPHSERLATEIDQTVRELGFNPTLIVYGLPGPDATTDEAKVKLANTILGEVARTLNNEQKLTSVS